MADEIGLSIWTIYKHPKDYPGKWVARRHEARKGYHFPAADVLVADDYMPLCEEMENRGLTRIGRQAGDDAVIVESWL